MDIDEDTLWRAVASICGALTVLADVAENDPKKPKVKDPMMLGLAYADTWLENIDPFSARDDDGVKFTLDRSL